MPPWSHHVDPLPRCTIRKTRLRYAQAGERGGWWVCFILGLGVAMPASSTFVSVNTPIGVAVDAERLLYTQYTVTSPGDPTIFSVSDTGVVSIFAPSFPSASGNIEKYIDISPGLGAWASKAHYVYVTHGSEIYEITPDGTQVSLFATLPSGTATHSGITFDGEGTFNNDMIVTDPSGNVFRADSVGSVTLVATIGEPPIEGPSVVPAGFGPHGGEVWVAAETAGAVFAVRNDGTVSVITREIPGAENVRVVPGDLSEFGASGGAYFAADYPARLIKYPAADFVNLAGNVLVGQEVSGGGIMMISESSGTYNVSPFDPSAFQGSAEGAAFVGPGRTLLVYAAKFLCGRLGPLDPKVETPVGPGSYTTAINVHNPSHRPVVMTKKAILLFAGASREKPETPRPPSRPHRLELGPDWGVEIDCQDIREVLLRSEQGVIVPAPTFIKGWVVLESTSPLDVEVVYTAQGLQRGLSLATERVHPTEVGPS